MWRRSSPRHRISSQNGCFILATIRKKGLNMFEWFFLTVQRAGSRFFSLHNAWAPKSTSNCADEIICQSARVILKTWVWKIFQGILNSQVCAQLIGFESIGSASCIHGQTELGRLDQDKRHKTQPAPPTPKALPNFNPPGNTFTISPVSLEPSILHQSPLSVLPSFFQCIYICFIYI